MEPLGLYNYLKFWHNASEITRSNSLQQQQHQECLTTKNKTWKFSILELVWLFLSFICCSYLNKLLKHINQLHMFLWYCCSGFCCLITLNLFGSISFNWLLTRLSRQAAVKTGSLWRQISNTTTAHLHLSILPQCLGSIPRRRWPREPHADHEAKL